MEMSDFDIYLDYKNAKRPEEQIKILAELNGTTPKAIQEIIDRMAEQEGVEVTDREDNPVDKLEKQAERQRKQSREYKRRVRAEERAEVETETKEEQEMSQRKETPEQKARKAAYMKEYWARKKAEKVSVVKTEEAEQEVVSMEEPKTQQDDSELIRKALKNFSIGLEEAIEDQKAILEATKKKLAAMEADLKRCRELLGYEIEAKEDVAENVCD